MAALYKDMGFIIGFLILILVVQTAFGGETSSKFLIIVLLSMLLLNYQTFADKLKSVFN